MCYERLTKRFLNIRKESAFVFGFFNCHIPDGLGLVAYRKFNMADSRSANMTTGGVNRSFWPHTLGPVPCPKESNSSRYPDTQLKEENETYDYLRPLRKCNFFLVIERLHHCPVVKYQAFKYSTYCCWERQVFERPFWYWTNKKRTRAQTHSLKI